MVKILRENKMASIVLAVIRVYLGYTWLTAGWHKIVDGFDASGFLKGGIANPVASHGEVVYPWWGSFLENFALPNVEIFNVMVPWGEFLVGLGLILGCLSTAAVFFALVMNWAFFFTGTVSTNPHSILLGVILLVSGFNASRYGLDRWVIPYIRKTVFKKDEKAANLYA